MSNVRNGSNAAASLGGKRTLAGRTFGHCARSGLARVDDRIGVGVVVLRLAEDLQHGAERERPADIAGGEGGVYITLTYQSADRIVALGRSPRRAG